LSKEDAGTRVHMACMKVTVKFQGILRRNLPDYDPNRPVEIELPSNATVADFLDHLSISYPQNMIVVMNHKIAKVTDEINDGAELLVFPLVSGG
jgi:sulfur carrier protein ThiS